MFFSCYFKQEKAAEAAYVPVIYYYFCQFVVIIKQAPTGWLWGLYSLKTAASS